MTFGPMQVLVVGFGDDAEFTGEIAAELRRLREHDIVRLADLLFVTKDEDGTVSSLETSDLTGEESVELGALAGALMGFGAAGEAGAEAGALAGATAAADGGSLLEDDVWYIADAIPPGTSAAVAILEHRWAIPLREAIERTGGGVVTDAWLHPSDLVEAGEAAAAFGSPRRAPGGCDDRRRDRRTDRGGILGADARRPGRRRPRGRLRPGRGHGRVLAAPSGRGAARPAARPGGLRRRAHDDGHPAAVSVGEPGRPEPVRGRRPRRRPRRGVPAAAGRLERAGHARAARGRPRVARGAPRTAPATGAVLAAAFDFGADPRSRRRSRSRTSWRSRPSWRGRG